MFQKIWVIFEHSAVEYSTLRATIQNIEETVAREDSRKVDNNHLV